MAADREKRGNPMKRLARRVAEGDAYWWPTTPVPELEQQPFFLFVLTTNYSGSTALAKIIDTSARSMTLNDSGEGQWLVPGLARAKWRPEAPVQWDSVRGVWLEQFREARAADPNVEVVIEKSPPNMMRADQLREQFPNSGVLGFTRNPYAFCASVINRKLDFLNLNPWRRQRKLALTANRWVRRTTTIADYVKANNLEYFTYEQLCADTPAAVAKIVNTCPLLDDINAHATFRVKNYKEQGLINQNDRQLALLSPDDIEIISEELNKAPELMEFYGYELMQS